MKISIVRHGSSEYVECVMLRDRVLREPLGLHFDANSLGSESGDFHLAAVNNSGSVVGCLVLTPVDSLNIRMRQVAVTDTHQGVGVGSLLVEQSEHLSRQLGYGTMILNAREEAIAFYERLDYQIVGDPFFEVGISHRHMEKTLSL